jgi:hypothetical protein
MSKRLRQTLVYGAAAGCFGGALWFALITVAPPEPVFSRNWWIAGVVATGVWCVLGALIGGIGLQPSSAISISRSSARVSKMPHLSIAGALGAVGYRLAIGLLIGVIVTSLFALLSIGFVFSAPVEEWRTTRTFSFLIASSMGGMIGGFVGAVFGALFAVSPLPCRRRTVDRWSIRAGIVGIALGVETAAIITAIEMAVTEQSRDWIAMMLLAGSSIAGLAAAALVGIWSRLIRARLNTGEDDR